ncbi:MAG: hypothetical protein H6577_00055 [Lewinellaceae bacterium]|nr:hypothetical protein [Saprospiraceae bacterium]MCB9336503.1 hypothetical protein [Lewinellaceae bacterium]
MVNLGANCPAGCFSPCLWDEYQRNDGTEIPYTKAFLTLDGQTRKKARRAFSPISSCQKKAGGSSCGTKTARCSAPVPERCTTAGGPGGNYPPNSSSTFTIHSPPGEKITLIFTSPTDLHLLPCSPALDMGSNAANSTSIDLGGNPLKVNATVIGTTTIDMGAYELQSNITLPSTWTGLGDGTLWSDPANWSDGYVPQKCRDVVIPTGTVTVTPGFHAVGKTLDVVTGAMLEAIPTSVLDVEN